MVTDGGRSSVVPPREGAHVPTSPSRLRGLVVGAVATAVAGSLAAAPAVAAPAAPQEAQASTLAAEADGVVRAAATNDAVVQSWYTDFLGRTDPAADPGRQFWVGQLDGGAPRADVLRSITESREYAELTVGALYALLLGRGLDPGAEYWVSGVDERGMAVEWVSQNIFASDEFFRTQARSDDYALVRIWYAALTGRTPTDGEVAYWVDRVQRFGRFRALREFWYAPESVATRVVVNYALLLERPPSQGELGYWAPLEVRSDREVAVLIASTPEYESLIGTR